MADYIEHYIRSGFRKDFADWVSLWVPSPSCDPEQKPSRGRTISLGDVGYFDDAGEFEVLFNIYLSEDENINNGYDPPTNFHHYDPKKPLKLQRKDRTLTLTRKADQVMMTGNLGTHVYREEFKGGYATFT